MTPDTDNSSPETSSAPQGAVEALARNWVRRRDAGLAPAERAEFRAWLAKDSSHTRAFAQADTQGNEFDWPWHTGTIDLVAAGLESRARRWRRSAAAAGGLAAGGLAALISAGLLWQARQPPTLGPASVSHTVVSQPDRQVLPDGSVVELKNGAQITVAFTAALRRVVLANGSAYFSVAKNRARPFLVQAAGVEVQAVGTAFAVQMGPQAVEVLVTEGRVAVDRSRSPSDPESRSPDSPPRPRPVFVDAGSLVAMPVSPEADRTVKVQALSEAERGEKLDWREPRLGFSGTPLSEVVVMMNHYNQVQFIIADPSLGQLRLSGVLRADKVDALVALLESDFGVSAERRADNQIVLRRAP